ncbi:MAG: formyltetrahydrofolate deformylase [Pseudomonadota bacterium]
MTQHYRLLISCPDRVGIVAKVSTFIAEQGGWLTEASYHSDQQSQRFFMRNEIVTDSLSVDKDTFMARFKVVADEFQMTWRLTDSAQSKRVALMVSKHSHCLADVLHRWQSRDLDCEIVAVISNHTTLSHMADWYQLPFHHVPMSTAEEKARSNEALPELLSALDVDLVVLARYMQIIPESLCEAYEGRMINIHHSFLPSFVGARPYQKAFERGVKLIGATCHYVTKDLDEGPIIEQDVVRVSHRYDEQEMLKKGKDVERNVLAQGLQYHLEDRVMIDANKTIILD